MRSPSADKEPKGTVSCELRKIACVVFRRAYPARAGAMHPAHPSVERRWKCPACFPQQLPLMAVLFELRYLP